MKKYELIKNDIIDKIKEGKLAPGEKIPTENELQKMYSVSSTTVVKALNELSLNGYLYRIQGRGTFVSKASRGILARYSENDYQKYDKNKEKTILLNVELIKINDKDLDDSFFENNELYKIERLKVIDDIPILYSISFIKKYLLDNTKKSDFKKFYDAIDKKHNINLFKAKKSLNFQSIIPNEEIKKLLKLEDDNFIIYIQQSTYLNESEKVEHTQTFKNPNFFNIDVETII
ncbi:GntR family transcriptional regulator [Helcococcus kunzii]|uniref:GntR family transcriptional regulator n=1 Tax=Helcococcus kunzii TaxID=40091 RepID=UPI0038AB3BEF